MPTSKCSILLAVVFVCSVTASGCAGKAQGLRVAVRQFEVESTAAVNAIDTMRQKEIAPIEQTQAALTNAFVDNVMQSKQPATVERVTFWLNPYAIDQNSEVEQAWVAFLDELRIQYTTFARIFDQIEQASFTGRESVQKATPYIEKLTAQLAYVAESIKANPPQLLQRRSALVATLEEIRRSNMPEADKRRQIATWHDQWLNLAAEEEELKRTTVEQCLKAAVIGQEIRRQLLNYDQLSLNDMSEAFTKALGVAGSVTGKNFSQLQAQSGQIIASINGDPVWKTAVEVALRTANKAIITRSQQNTSMLGVSGVSSSALPSTR